MNNLLEDLLFVVRHLRSPFSLAKWMVRNRKVALSFALYAIFPLIGFLLTLTLAMSYLLAVWIGVWFSVSLVAALLAWLISATSEWILGKYISFEYVFCAISSTQLVTIPLLLIGGFFAALGVGFVLHDLSLMMLFSGIGAMIAAPAIPAAFALLTLVFAAFKIDQNRLVRAVAIYMTLISITFGILTAFVGRGLLTSIYRPPFYTPLLFF